MQTHFLKQPFERGSDGADPSINIRDLIYPEIETNTDEGDEYMDDQIRIMEQPLRNENENENKS